MKLNCVKTAKNKLWRASLVLSLNYADVGLTTCCTEVIDALVCEQFSSQTGASSGRVVGGMDCPITLDASPSPVKTGLEVPRGVLIQIRRVSSFKSNWNDMQIQGIFFFFSVVSFLLEKVSKVSHKETK